jgi:hypothetical protein
MVNLAEILVYTDIRQLHQIANHYGCECNPHSKNDLITTLLSNLRHRSTIQAEVERLTSVEIHFLMQLLLDKRTLFSMEDLLAKASVALDAEGERNIEEARILIADSLMRGWIFPAKGRTVGQYQIPHDLREPYLQAWLKMRKGTNEPSAMEPTAYRDEGTAMCDDLYQFLRFLEQEPVPLTADGGMYKRYQSQLFRFFSVVEKPLPPQKWRFGYGLHFDLYPDRFSLIYDYCYYQRWIEETPGNLRINEKGMELLSVPYSEQIHQELVRFWLRLYKRAIPNLPMFVQLIPVMTGGGWVAQSWLADNLLPWIKPFYYDDPANILHNRILKMMVHLGLMRVGQGDDGEWMYSHTELCQSWLKSYNGFTESTILLK